MRISLIVPSLARKGPVIVAWNLAQELVNSGNHVVVYYLDEERELEFPCPVEHFRFSSLKAIREADIVHSHSLRPDALAWCCRRLLGFKGVFVSTIHNYVVDDLSFRYGKLTSWFFSRVWRILWSGLSACAVLTNHARDYYLKMQPGLNLHVLPNGRPNHDPLPIPAADAALLDDFKRRFRIIGAAALITRVKGLEQVVQALPLLDGYAFLVIGDGPDMESLARLADRLGVRERLLLLGFRTNARDYLPLMDIYAMPSYSEGMPLAMLEAASANVPIVCSDIPVFRELFSDDEVTFFSLDDPNALVDAVRRLERAPSVFAEKAKVRFNLCYSAHVMANGYLNLYRSLLATDAGAGRKSIDL